LRVAQDAGGAGTNREERVRNAGRHALAWRPHPLRQEGEMDGNDGLPRRKNGQFAPRSAEAGGLAKPKPERVRARKAAPQQAIKWTREKETVFFRELAMVCNVSSALRKAKLNGCSSLAYERRKKDPRFRAAWEEAIDQSYAMLELEMLERTRFGDDRPPPATEAEKRLRAIPTALALQLLKLYENRVKARGSATTTRAGRPIPAKRVDAMALRREFDALLSDFNRRMGGKG
jgi:hypothetical protein